MSGRVPVRTASAQAAGNPKPRVLGRSPSLLAALSSDLAWWGVRRGSQVPFTGELAFIQCRHKSDFRPSREGRSPRVSRFVVLHASALGE